MALEPRDLVYPRGVIKPSQYPDEKLFKSPTDTDEGLLDVWLEQASELAPNSETAQRAYVLWRHYSAQAERYAEEFSSWSEGGVSRSRTGASLEHFRRLAAGQQALYQRLTGKAPPKHAGSGTTGIEASF